MYCNNCDSFVSDGTTFCPSCGIKLPTSAQAPYQQPAYTVTTQQEMPMKWFKFLIYFGLFASFVLNIYGGGMILAGAHYGSEQEASLVYAVFEDLKTLDIIVGIGMLAAGVLALYARFRLAGYRQNGPKMITALYTTALVTNTICIIGLTAIVSEASSQEIDMSSYFANLATSFAMIVANSVYFKKRQHLFVN